LAQVKPREDFSGRRGASIAKNDELLSAAGGMRYLTLEEVLELHRLVWAPKNGGTTGVRELAALESHRTTAMAFGGKGSFIRYKGQAPRLPFHHPESRSVDGKIKRV